MSKISIALCTYNGAAFLQQQLESFLDQIRLPDELVVGDDCSKDETLCILENFAARASFPVRIQVNPQNLGSTKNFEQTILRCGGDVIFMSDQDDVWLPCKIEKTLRVLEENPEVGFVFTDAALVDEKLQPLNINLWKISFFPEEQRQARDNRMLEVLLNRNVVTGATIAFRTEFRKSFVPIPIDIPNMIHDAWIALIIAAQAKAEFISEPLMKYRQHTEQQLGIDWRHLKSPRQIADDRAKVYTKLIDFYQMELKRLQICFEILSENPFFFQHRSTLETTVEKASERCREIIAHYQARGKLPANRLRRAAVIFGEVLSGRYHRFSKGWLSAAKDLFENL